MLDSLTVEQESVIGRNPADVWKLLADIGSWSRWNPVIDHLAVYGPFQAGTQFRCASGKWDFNGQILEIETERCLLLHTSSIGLRLELTWVLSQKNSGTIVRATASASGWMALFLKRKLSKALQESLSMWLSSLKARCEKGGVQVGISGDIEPPAKTTAEKTGYAFPFTFIFGPIGGRKRKRSGI